MSVINKMLQDLEQRGVATEQPSLLAANMPAHRRSWLKRWPLIWLLTALVCTVLLSWQFIPKKTAQLEPEPLHSQPVAIAENETAFQPEQTVSRDKAEAEMVSQPALATIAAVEPEVEPEAEPESVAKSEPEVVPGPETAPEPVAVASRTASQGQLSIARHTESAAAQQQRLLAEVRQAQQNGQSAEAIRLLQQLQQQQPSELAAYIQLARIYSQQQQWQTARQWLLQALSQGLEQPEVYFMLASLAAEQQDWLQALEHLPARFELASQPDYYGLKAAVLQQLGRPADAYFWYRQLHVLQPTQARWSLGAAVVLEQQQQQRAARYYFQQALVQRQSLSAASVDYIQQRLAATDP